MATSNKDQILACTTTKTQLKQHFQLMLKLSIQLGMGPPLRPTPNFPNFCLLDHRQ